MPNPSILAYEEDYDEDEDTPSTKSYLPAHARPDRLTALPEVTITSPLKDVQKADLLQHQIVLHNLNKAWGGARSVKDVVSLAATTLATLRQRREMLLHPTKKEAETKHSLPFDPVD